MTTKQFIKKAIEGGWFKGARKITSFTDIDVEIEYEIFPLRAIYFKRIPFTTILIDPLAWQAVGKVEGWKETEIKHKIGMATTSEWVITWKYNMLAMTQALIDGKSIEDYLKTL